MKKRIISLLIAAFIVLQSGIISFAGDTETPIVPTNPNVQINGLSIVLSGEIGLTFYVYVAKPYRGGTMEFTFMDKEPITMNIIDCPVDNSTHRFMATYYLSAIELSEPVTLSVYAADDTEHDKPLAQASYSAEDYVGFLLKDEKATEKEKNVAKTLINYGHYAQLALSEANGWKIGEDYAETTEFFAPTVDTSVFDNYKIDWQNKTELSYQMSMSLSLDYKTGINLYFPLEEKPTVTVNGKAVDVIESERLEDNYEVRIEGINALNLEGEYEITVNGDTFTLSALSYCCLAASYETTEHNIDAMKALYEFYQATVIYNTPAEK